MRAAFSDPQGRRTWRMAPFAGPLALFLLACFGPWEVGTAVLVAILAIALLHLVGMMPLRQGRKKSAELVCGPGYVEVKKAGTRNQRIDARSIVGATTARTAGGILFTLSHVDRDQPLLIEVDSDADADKIRHALGIGHGGYGTVSWRTAHSTASKTGFIGRLLTFLIGSLVVGLGFFVSHEAAGIVGLMSSQFAFLAIILSLVGWLSKASPPSVVMASEGLRIHTTRGWFTVPYGHVQGIEHVGGALRFHVPQPYHAVDVATTGNLIGHGLGGDDRDALIEQIMSASARARGLGPSKNDVTGRLDTLRRNGESPREWLTRLDMAGRMLGSGTAGYRGHTLDADDLWAILEDPEAEADLRAAAARILRHSPRTETRTRIDAAVAAVRDDATNRKLRIAIRDDVDGASHELAMLDAQEPMLRTMHVR